MDIIRKRLELNKIMDDIAFELNEEFSILMEDDIENDPIILNILDYGLITENSIEMENLELETNDSVTNDANNIVFKKIPKYKLGNSKRKKEDYKLVDPEKLKSMKNILNEE